MALARIIVVIAAALAIASIASTQDEAARCAGSPEVAFNHEAEPSVQSSPLKRKDGEKFLIRVVNTDPELFSYTVTGAVAVPRRSDLELVGKKPVYETCVTHSKAFGGHLMTVEKKPGRPQLSKTSCSSCTSRLRPGSTRSRAQSGSPG